MLTKNERFEKMNAMGINTSKYFTLDLDNGTTIHLIIDENGNPMVVNNKENDHVANQIIEDGYVRNTKLHRRFVCAQMFHMLNYESWDGEDCGYNACLKRMYGYDYTFKMMLDEVKVLSKLEIRDRESFEERSHFFTKNVVISVMEDYMKKLEEYINKLPNKNCKGVPYKRIKGANIFNDDLNKRIYLPLKSHICNVRYSRSYADVHKHLSKFMRDMVGLPYNTAKSKVWIDTFKGEGAYYTLKNLVMFHNCNIVSVEGIDYGVNSMAYLNSRLDAYSGEGWRMFALMKKVIADNNFDFYARMREIYNN